MPYIQGQISNAQGPRVGGGVARGGPQVGTLHCTALHIYIGSRLYYINQSKTWFRCATVLTVLTVQGFAETKHYPNSTLEGDNEHTTLDHMLRVSYMLAIC